MASRLPSLPLDIVEHIQSFMSYRDATRSAAACSRLYYTWSIRKHVDIDECLFPHPSICGRVGMQILNRYRDEELELEKFTIRIGPVADRVYHTQQVIEAAAKMGIFELNIILSDDRIAYRIPMGIFESTSLVKLSVVGGALNICKEIPVICQNLKFLSLLPDRYMNLGNDLMNCYLMRCPNLEILVCRGHLLHFDTERLGNRLHNLESLIVETLTYQEHLWFTMFIASLPCLKRLTIRKLFNCRNLLIHSATVERVSIEDCLRPVSAILRFPRLRLFHFKGVSSSSFRFQTSLRGVIAEVNVVSRRHVANWLSGIHGLLRCLSFSKIFLSVRVLDNDMIRLPEADHYHDPITVELLELRTVVQDPLLAEGLLNLFDPDVFRYDYG